jgi:hypothetical protein
VRRILAAVVAVLFLVGGFAAYRFRTNPDRGQQVIRLWCVDELSVTCEAVTREFPDRFQITVSTPIEIEKQILASNADTSDAFLSSSLWLGRVNDRLQRKPQDIAQSPLVLITRSQTNGCPVLSCAKAARVAIGTPSDDLSALSALAATGTALGLRADTLDSGTSDEDAAIQVLRLARERGPVTEALAIINATPTIDAVVAVKALTQLSAALRVTPVAPVTVVDIQLAANKNDSRLDTLAEFLRADLTRRGWDTPTKGGSFGDTALANALLDRTR